MYISFISTKSETRHAAVVLSEKDKIVSSYFSEYPSILLTEANDVQWVPTLVIEDQTGKHKFEGPQEIKKVLYEIVSPS